MECAVIALGNIFSLKTLQCSVTTSLTFAGALAQAEAAECATVDHRTIGLSLVASTATTNMPKVHQPTWQMRQAEQFAMRVPGAMGWEPMFLLWIFVALGQLCLVPRKIGNV